MAETSSKPHQSSANIEDDSDVVSDDDNFCDDSSVVQSSTDASDSELIDSSDFDEIVSTQALGSQLTESDVECVRQTLDKLNTAVHSVRNVQPMRNVNITNSQNVHIGPKTTVTGDIIIQKTLGRPAVSKVRARRPKPRAREPEERVECVDKNMFMKSLNIKVPRNVLNIQPRWSWLAQKPMEEYDYIEGPVEYVIICHTASESSTKQPTNIKLIRHIQMYHIESYQWNDIAYNFMIGCDGNIYEGRGWGVVGAHTLGYNTKSLGIAVVGCFMNELPSSLAMNALRNLLKKGIELGHLKKDYKLIAPCQVRTTESPGRMFFEELQKWKHFHSIECAVEEGGAAAEEGSACSDDEESGQLSDSNESKANEQGDEQLKENDRKAKKPKDQNKSE